MRPTRDNTLMNTAYLWAKRSTCSRLNVGAVFSREGRILVQGYNGAPAGLAHCNHDCDCQARVARVDHADLCNSQLPCTVSVHAEANGIAYAARWGVELRGSLLSCTHQPCLNCAMLIIGSGVAEIQYVEQYRLRDGLELLWEAGIGAYQIDDFPIPPMIR